MSKTTSTTATDPKAAKRASEVRHYVLLDAGTQWFTKLARIEVETSWENVKKGPSVHKEIIVSEELLDVPSTVSSQPFLCNVYGRQQVPWLKLKGETWGGWSISPLEYERIKQLIQLNPTKEQFERLAGYP